MVSADPEKGQVPTQGTSQAPKPRDSTATLSESTSGIDLRGSVITLDTGPLAPTIEPSANTSKTSTHPASIQPKPSATTPTELLLPEVDSQNTGITYRYLTFDTELPGPNLVSRNGPNETAPTPPSLIPFDDPKTWNGTRKAFAVGSVATAGLTVAYSSSSYAFAVPGVVQEFGVSENVANLGILLFNIAFGLTPMLCAPLSESIGRMPVFMASGAVFLIGQLVCGVTPTFAGLLIARILVGIGGSTFSTIVGGVVADIFTAESRNTPMAGFSSTTLIGVGSGLAVSGALVQHNDWRWVFYLQTITSAVSVLVVVICLKETRGNVVLRRKAQALNKWYQQLEDRGFFGVDHAVSSQARIASNLDDDDGLAATNNSQDEKQLDEKHLQQKEFNPPVSEPPPPSPSLLSGQYEVIRWRVEADDTRPRMRDLIGTSVRRPFHMLFTEPVVFFFSMWAMFVWSILYLTFESIPLCFTTTYGFGPVQNGRVFAAIVAGTLIILPLCLAYDRWARRRPRFSSTPEGRLFFVAVVSACCPIGLFWFGWSLQPYIASIVPAIGVGILGIGIFTVYLAVFNYFADVYGPYSSSAMAAQSFCRNVVSSVFPFFSNIMFVRLGFGPAASLLGAIAVLLMVAPVLLLLNGPKIRARSRYIEK